MRCLYAPCRSCQFLLAESECLLDFLRMARRGMRISRRAGIADFQSYAILLALSRSPLGTREVLGLVPGSRNGALGRLKLLRKRGFARGRREGMRVVYSITEKGERLLSSLDSVYNAWRGE